MYAEEQTRQNLAENKTGEEKPLKTKEEFVKSEVKDQISEKEQIEIQNLLQDQVQETEPTEENAVEDQISKQEKKEIATLLKDGQEAAEPNEKKPKKKKIGKQISAEENKEIRRLINDGYTSEETEKVQKEINYDELNKQQLVELLEEVVEEKDITKIKSKLSRIKTVFHRRNKEDIDRAREAFVNEGGKPEEFKHAEDPLEQRFNAAFSKYRHHKAKFAEDLEKQKTENLQIKLNILEELKELINSEETLKKTYDEFRHLQDRWKEVGMVPAGELNNLWQNYHFLVEMFFDKVRINKELRDLDLKKNLELKIKICESTEELLLEKSPLRSFKLLQKYHDEWREVGPVPVDKKDELWERFKAATDKINERRRDYYKNIQEEQERNYQAKLSLCEKIEEIEINPEDNLKNWQKKTDQVNELFRVWKTIGRAPKATNDEVWKRFHKAMDQFFSSKREFLDKLKQEQTENLNRKIDLCIKAEAVKDSSDWKQTTNELIALQKEWKKIGPVPRRHSDKVWKRFRAACDEFFNRKSEHFKSIRGEEKENQKEKESLIKEINDLKIDKDKRKNLDALKAFQRRWMEIGYVPFKEKDRLQQEYRQAVDALIDKMDINRTELSKAGFEEKVEIMKNDPNADKMISRERSGLQKKIKEISDEIALWENNITFFASNKKSDQMRQEFEKKIDKARKEVEVLQSKLKMLKQI